MNPYAYYDSLAILSKLCKRIGNGSSAEVHVFAYLSCLLSLYKQRPISEWGYGFAGTRTGVPFSAEIDEAIRGLVGSGYFAESDGVLILTQPGQRELSELANLQLNKEREPFLEGACSSLVTLPIGMVRSAISADPDIASAGAVQSPRPLLQQSALQELYDAFAALSKEIGVKVTDLMLPATVWLTYLSEVATDNSKEGKQLEDRSE